MGTHAWSQVIGRGPGAMPAKRGEELTPACRPSSMDSSVQFRASSRRPVAPMSRAPRLPYRPPLTLLSAVLSIALL